MYDIAICDDNRADRETLKQLLLDNTQCPEEINLYEFQSGEDLLGSMKDRRYTLVFLDIQMEGMDGNQAAKEIRRVDNKVLLVFITGYVDPTPFSFEVQPYRYLMKRMPREELEKNIGEIFLKLVSDVAMPMIEARIGERDLLLCSEDIVFIEKYRRKSRIHISPWAAVHYGIRDKDDLRSDEKLEQIFERFKYHGFGCPHSSYIVNYKFITEASKTHFRLEGINNEFSITRSKAQVFNHQKTQCLLSKYMRGGGYAR